MSRGLGTVQRRILATLAEARAVAPSYPGSGDRGPGLPADVQGTPAAEGWIWVGRSLVHLAPDVYDLRCTLAYLAAQPGARRQRWTARGRVSNPLEATVSRAVRSLVRLGRLEPLWFVPCDAVDPLFCRDREVAWCQDVDGTCRHYIVWRAREQIRFVSVKC